MMKKFLAALLLLIIVCSPFVTPVVSADEESDYKARLSELAEQEAEYRRQLSEAKADIKDKEARSDALVSEIEILNEEISLYNEEIYALGESIYEKQEIVDQANADVEAQVEALKKRLRAIYMAGDASDLDIILGAKDFSDFLDKVELIRSLADYDKKLIKKIEKRLNEVSAEKEALEAEKAELEEAEETLEEKQYELNDLLAENEEVLAGLYQAKSDAKSLLEDVQAQEDEVQSQLDAYYASLQQDDDNSGGGSGGGDVVISGSGYTWPAPGVYYIVGDFGEDRGYSHKGIDIACSMGSTIVAAESGTVIASNNDCSHNWGKSGSCGCGGGFGNYVMIDHGGGYSTTYGHLTTALVSAGETVSKGQVIGYSGSTGWSEGPHLHFETRYYGEAYDPMSEY